MEEYSDPARTLRARLRGETAQEHKALEAATGLAHELGEGGEVQLRYVHFLRTLYGALAPLEESLVRCPQYRTAIADFEARQRRDLLAADLKDLGAWAPEPTRCDHLPDITGLPRKLGLAYVLEGATLGGQVIHRRMRASGLQDGALRYAYGAGPETPRLFARFMAAMVTALPGAEEQDQAVRAARDGFRALRVWFERAPAPAISLQH